MNELTRLQSYHELNEAEATEVLLAWAKRHTDMLDNLLRIKSTAPQDEEQGGFRRQRHDSVSLEALRELLQGFIKKLLEFSQSEIKTSPLLGVVKGTENELSKLYEGKSTAFAVILNELNALENVLLQKLPKTESEKIETSARITTSEMETKEMFYVYVRVFHRQLSQLPLPESDKSWLKTLLESVRESEKHGLAVYANEDDVKKSIRGENYGYVTIAITPDQDLTHQRLVKQDPQLFCPLMTVASISLDQLKKLTYAEIDYLIENGVIRRAEVI